MTEAGKENALDTTLAMLADESRRLVLRYLRETPNGVASRQELIDYIRRHGSGGYDAEHLKIHLHHACLPKLADAALIDWDSRRDTVRYRPQPMVEELLAHIETIDRKRR